MSDPDIIFRYTDDFELVWFKSGKNDFMNTMHPSIWRAIGYESGFYSLGDVPAWSVVTDNHPGIPLKKALLVSEKKAGALAEPVTFQEMFVVHEKGNVDPLRIHSMTPPKGYTSLGFVASFKTAEDLAPDLTRYRCIKNEYLVEADTQEMFQLFSHPYEVYWFSIITRGARQTEGLSSETFVARADKGSFPTVFLINYDGEKVQNAADVPKKCKPLNLHEVTDLTDISGFMIGTFRRPKSIDGFFSLGDQYVPKGVTTKGFLVRPTDMNDDAVRAPESYTEIFSFMREDPHIQQCTVWRVNPPAGYVALGDIITTDGKYPSPRDVYCVKSCYTITGTESNWKNNGHFFNAVTTSDDQQSVLGFRFAKRYIDCTEKPNPPFLLDTRYLNYWTERPIKEIYVYNVEYEVNQSNCKANQAPIGIHSTVVENSLGYCQNLTRQITYSITETSSFEFSQETQDIFKWNASPSFKINIKILEIGMGGKVEKGTVKTITVKDGESVESRQSDTITAEIKIASESKLEVSVTGTQYKASVNFKAKMKIIYDDGSEQILNSSGIYNHVAINDIVVTYCK